MRDFQIKQTFVIIHHVEAPTAAAAKRIIEDSVIEMTARFDHVATVAKGNPQFHSVPCTKCNRRVYQVKACVYCRPPQVRRPA